MHITYTNLKNYIQPLPSFYFLMKVLRLNKCISNENIVVLKNLYASLKRGPEKNLNSSKPVYVACNKIELTVDIQ